MAKPEWKSEIGSCFDDLRILEKCRAEVDAHFMRFYESVAEPAFRALADEFRLYKVRCRYGRAKGNRFHFEASFPGRREPQFEYALWVPPKAVEFSLLLTVQGRTAPIGKIMEKTFPFLQSLPVGDILAMLSDDLAHDFVARYKRFVTQAALTPDGAPEAP
jgi:hypothetical protein